MAESTDYLKTQLIHYRGSKRKLLPIIGEGLTRVRNHLGKDKLTILDAFSGSGVVSRYFKQYADLLIVNDFEDYAGVIGRCYLSNRPSKAELSTIKALRDFLEAGKSTTELGEGFIAKLYSPKDDNDIQNGERCYYTRRNASILDNLRRLIDDNVSQKLKPFFIAPLLYPASVNANTSGHFLGFHRNTDTKIGKFGGTKSQRVESITAEIVLPVPIFSNYSCDMAVYQKDIFTLAPKLDEVDVAYLDPPYSRTGQYGACYFMLNLITTYKEPADISQNSGIPADWRRTDFYFKNKAATGFDRLIGDIKAKTIMVSYSDEGLIEHEQIMSTLSKHGRVQVIERKHRAFQGGKRYTGQKSGKVIERLYILYKS